MQNADNTANIKVIKDEIQRYIDQMDEYHARLVLSFFQTLYKQSD